VTIWRSFRRACNGKNLDWLFPTLPNKTNILDSFCNLSLTYRSNEFVMMPAPLRDYLYPKDPKSSQLPCATKDSYPSRLSVRVSPGGPGFEEAQWIMSEDANVEHSAAVLSYTDVQVVGPIHFI